MAVLSISNNAAKAAVDAIVDRLDLGSGPAFLRIYSGTAPAFADDALSGNTLLAELVMSDPAFGSAADIAPGARAAASTITDDALANATGTATFFRLLQSDGTTVEIQGDVTNTGGGGTLTINNVNIQINTVVQCTSLTIQIPEI